MKAYFVGSYVEYTISIEDGNYNRYFKGDIDDWHEELATAILPVIDTALIKELNKVLEEFKYA